MSNTETAKFLADKIVTSSTAAQQYKQSWEGTASGTRFSKRARESLGNRLSTLSVNYPRLWVRALTDRLTVRGFRTRGDDGTDDTLWQLWRTAGLIAKAPLVHTDRAVYGAAYVTIWAHARDPHRPVVMLDTPTTAAADIDPATGEVLSFLRTWKPSGSRETRSLLVTPETLTIYRSQSDVATAGSFTLVSEIPNPYGIAPVVPFVRRQSSTDHDGASMLTDILPVVDAHAKLLQDAVVTSEYSARPRRWATGLEIEEDDDGNAIDPFGEHRFMQSEDPDTKFGQLEPTRLDAYGDLLDSLTASVGALTGLPAHYLGVHGDQPANAESIRAAESQLVAQGFAEQDQLDGPWADVASWLDAIVNERDPRDDIRTVFESPETRTPSQAADAATKLAGIGVPLRSLLTNPLRYEPHEIESIITNRSEDQLADLVAAMSKGTP